MICMDRVRDKGGAKGASQHIRKVVTLVPCDALDILYLYLVLAPAHPDVVPPLCILRHAVSGSPPSSLP